MSAAVASPKPAGMPWWLLLVQGIVAIIVGIFLLANPLKTTNILVWAIALYWFLTGIIALVRLFWDRRQWGWKLFMGIVGILAGWFLLTSPPGERVVIFGFTVVLLLGIQGIIMGIAGLIEAFRGGGWGPGIMGGLAIIFGILILGNMVAAALVLPWVIGIFAIVGGIFAMIMSFRLKSAMA